MLHVSNFKTVALKRILLQKLYLKLNSTYTVTMEESTINFKRLIYSGRFPVFDSYQRGQKDLEWY